MNILTQEAKKKQAVVKYADQKGKSKASRKFSKNADKSIGP